MKTIIITNPAPKNIEDIITIKSTDKIIAVDGAVKEVIRQKIKIDLAIGDFDSLDNLNLIKDLTVVKLKKEKDETDTFVAVKYAYENYNNKVILLGGIKGDRIEHFIANYYLFDSYPKLTIIDENSTIFLLEEGKHLISKKGYVSFFPYGKSVISLSGFKYNLSNYILNRFDPLCISNEVLKLYGEITVLEGRVIVIKSKKK